MSESAAEFTKELVLLNAMSHEATYAEFLRCCGSARWATEMTNRRPYSSFEALKETAWNLWWSMPREEWLVAFTAHPKIGKWIWSPAYPFSSYWLNDVNSCCCWLFPGDAKALKEKFAHKNSWEGDEQSGANTASDAVLQGLQTLNTEYDLKYGFIFLICATGKSAVEMLEALQIRLRNDRDTEVSS